jgi:DDE superfamily endonuclease
MKYEFLPPYSPDFNPIEPGFSAMKAHLQRHGGLFRAATESQQDHASAMTQLHEAIWSISPQDAEGWFRHSGYI